MLSKLTNENPKRVNLFIADINTEKNSNGIVCVWAKYLHPYITSFCSHLHFDQNFNRLKSNKGLIRIKFFFFLFSLFRMKFCLYRNRLQNMWKEIFFKLFVFKKYEKNISKLCDSVVSGIKWGRWRYLFSLLFEKKNIYSRIKLHSS